MTWKAFTDSSDLMFRREYGIENTDTGERVVIAWLSKEILDASMLKSREFNDWQWRAMGLCVDEADRRNDD